MKKKMVNSAGGLQGHIKERRWEKGAYCLRDLVTRTRYLHIMC